MAKAAKKWIFRFRGDADQSKVPLLLSVLKNHSIKILDDRLPKMVLVTGADKDISLAKKDIDDKWTVVQEGYYYPIPDTKKKIER